MSTDVAAIPVFQSQHQESITDALPTLFALLEFSDFREGLSDGEQAFQEGMFSEDHVKAWTEDEIIRFIGEKLSEKTYRREQCMYQAMGQPSLTYLHHLGFVISYLDQTLATRAH